MAAEKRISRRELLCAAALGAAGAVVAGCAPKQVEVEKVVTEVVKETVIVAGTPEVVEKEVEKVVTATPMPAAEKVALELWHDWGPSDGEPFCEHLARFNEQSTDIEIKYDVLRTPEMDTKIAAAIATGDPPDIGVYFRPPVRWYRANALAPLDDVMRDVGLDFDDFYPVTLEANTCEGQLLQLPWNVVAMAAYINTEHAEQAGLDITNPPTDEASLLSWADAMTVRQDGVVTRSGFLLQGSGGQPNCVFGILTYQGGGRLLNEDYTEVILNETDAPARAAQFVLDCLDTWKISSRDVADLYKAFGQSEASIFYTGSWMARSFYETVGLESMTAPVPKVGEELLTYGATNGLFLFKAPGRDTEIRAGAEALKWLSDNQVLCLPDMGGASPRKSVLEDPKFREGGGVPWEYRQPFMDAVGYMFNARPPVLDAQNFDVRQSGERPIAKAMDPVWLGERSIEEGLAMAEEGLKEALKAHWDTA